MNTDEHNLSLYVLINHVIRVGFTPHFGAKAPQWYWYMNSEMTNSVCHHMQILSYYNQSYWYGIQFFIKR